MEDSELKQPRVRSNKVKRKESKSSEKQKKNIANEKKKNQSAEKIPKPDEKLKSSKLRKKVTNSSKIQSTHSQKRSDHKKQTEKDAREKEKSSKKVKEMSLNKPVESNSQDKLVVNNKVKTISNSRGKAKRVTTQHNKGKSSRTEKPCDNEQPKSKAWEKVKVKVLEESSKKKKKKKKKFKKQEDDFRKRAFKASTEGWDLDNVGAVVDELSDEWAFEGFKLKPTRCKRTANDYFTCSLSESDNSAEPPKIERWSKKRKTMLYSSFAETDEEIATCKRQHIVKTAGKHILQNLPNLQDREAFKSAGQKADEDAIASWTNEVLPCSLTIGKQKDDAELDNFAIKFHGALLIFCKDKRKSFFERLIGSSKEPQGDDIIQCIKTCCSVKNTFLRDELYAILIKQLTNNPSRYSRIRLWRVLFLVLLCFSPANQKMTDIVESLICSEASTEPNRQMTSVSGAAGMCLWAFEEFLPSPAEEVKVPLEKLMAKILKIKDKDEPKESNTRKTIRIYHPQHSWCHQVSACNHQNRIVSDIHSNQCRCIVRYCEITHKALAMRGIQTQMNLARSYKKGEDILKLQNAKTLKERENETKRTKLKRLLKGNVLELKSENEYQFNSLHNGSINMTLDCKISTMQDLTLICASKMKIGTKNLESFTIQMRFNDPLFSSYYRKLDFTHANVLETHFRLIKQIDRDRAVNGHLVFVKWRYTLSDILEPLEDFPPVYVEFLFDLVRNDFLKGLYLRIWDKKKLLNFTLMLLLEKWGNTHSFPPYDFFSQQIYQECAPVDVISVIFPLISARENFYAELQFAYRCMEYQCSLHENRLHFIGQLRQSPHFGLSFYDGLFLEPKLERKREFNEYLRDEDGERIQLNDQSVLFGVGFGLCIIYDSKNYRIRKYNLDDTSFQNLQFTPVNDFLFNKKKVREETGEKDFLTSSSSEEIEQSQAFGMITSKKWIGFLSTLWTKIIIHSIIYLLHTKPSRSWR